MRHHLFGQLDRPLRPPRCVLSPHGRRQRPERQGHQVAQGVVKHLRQKPVLLDKKNGWKKMKHKIMSLVTPKF